MSKSKTGYGSPPEHCRFKKGVSGNPKGRPKRQRLEVGEVVMTVMDAAVEFRERGLAQKAPRWELAIRRHLKKAIEGDVRAAEALLKIRAQAMAKKAMTKQIVRFCDLLPTPDQPTNGKIDQLLEDAPDDAAVRPASTQDIDPAS